MVVRILFILKIWAALLLGFNSTAAASVDSIAAEALQVLREQSLLVEQLAIERAHTEVRLHQASSPLIQAVGIWHEEEAIFPDPDAAPHIYDTVIAHNQTRLENLRQSQVTPAIEAFDIHANRIFYCEKPSFSICLLVSTDALAKEMNISKAQLVKHLFSSETPSSPSFTWVYYMILIGLIVIVGMYFVRPKERKLKDMQGFPVNEVEEVHQPYRQLETAHIVHMGDMEIDPKRMLVRRGEYEVGISQRDLKILLCLSDNPDEVITKDRLYNAGWGRDFVPNSRSLEQHILTLRNKIDPQRDRIILIETVHGQGYRYPKTL